MGNVPVELLLYGTITRCGVGVKCRLHGFCPVVAGTTVACNYGEGARWSRCLQNRHGNPTLLQRHPYPFLILKIEVKLSLRLIDFITLLIGLILRMAERCSLSVTLFIFLYIVIILY